MVFIRHDNKGHAGELQDVKAGNDIRAFVVSTSSMEIKEKLEG